MSSKYTCLFVWIALTGFLHSFTAYSGCPLIFSSEVTAMDTCGGVYVRMDTTVKKGSRIALLCSPGAAYKWTPSNGLTNDIVQGPTATIDDSITYRVAITDTSDSTCIYTEIFRIKIETTIPNIFTPNADNKNDVFEIYGLLPNSALQVFNRWGKLVFEESIYANKWDGKTTSGGELADGIYYYVLKSPSASKEWNGYVHLIR